VTNSGTITAATAAPAKPAPSNGAGSGIEMSVDSWGVFTFDDAGKITRVQLFLQHEEAEARRALSGG
jgi:hypothetical protein